MRLNIWNSSKNKILTSSCLLNLISCLRYICLYIYAVLYFYSYFFTGGSPFTIRISMPCLKVRACCFIWLLLISHKLHVYTFCERRTPKGSRPVNNLFKEWQNCSFWTPYPLHMRRTSIFFRHYTVLFISKMPLYIFLAM